MKPFTRIMVALQARQNLLRFLVLLHRWAGGRGDGPGVIVLEDDVFPDEVDGVLPEDPETVPRPCQKAEEPARRPQRERHPPVWTRDYQMNI